VPQRGPLHVESLDTTGLPPLPPREHQGFAVGRRKRNCRFEAHNDHTDAPRVQVYHFLVDVKGTKSISSENRRFWTCGTDLAFLDAWKYLGAVSMALRPNGEGRRVDCFVFVQNGSSGGAKCRGQNGAVGGSCGATRPGF
jgi:hypothetical protein